MKIDPSCYSVCISVIKRGKKGGSQVLDICMQEEGGGGGASTCVLSATRGLGVSKNRKKKGICN